MRPRDPIPAPKDQIAHIVVDRLAGWSQANAAALLDTEPGGEIDVTVTWSSWRRWIAARPR